MTLLAYISVNVFSALSTNLFCKLIFVGLLYWSKLSLYSIFFGKLFLIHSLNKLTIESHFWLFTNLKLIFAVAVFGIEFLKNSVLHELMPVISMHGSHQDLV